MEVPTLARVEYYRPELDPQSEWVEVRIDGPDGIAPLLELDRRCVSVQIGPHVYRYAEALAFWDDEDFIYVVADGRPEWGGSYFESIGKHSGLASRARISRQQAQAMLGNRPFVGVSMSNAHARSLGFLRE
ncbi:MAG: hypothetical protein LN413_00290 [Candidatus Thermoplasmatota archaeon]|nr:hypothetical protein [Candidatus Thermoplasmatota archaeon]